MSQHTHRSAIPQPRHQAPVQRRRRIGVTTGALLTGTALVLGTAGGADAKVTDPIPVGHYSTADGTLFDNCKTGFTGSLDVTATQVKVRFTPSAAYVGGAAGVDVRGTSISKDNNGRTRSRVVRLKADYDPLTAGAKSNTFTLPNGGVWRFGVTATTAADPLNDVHALDYEAGPCE